MAISSYFRFAAKVLNSPHKQYLKESHKPILDEYCLFEAGQGKNIQGNMFALVLAAKRSVRFANYHLAFVVTEDTDVPARQLFSAHGVSDLEFVRRDSVRYESLLARAQYLFTDNSFPVYFSKRDGQTYLNTWHGTPLKHLGFGDLSNSIASLANVQKNFLSADFVLFPNDLTRRVFWDDYQIGELYSHHVLMADYPRNDALLSMDIRNQIRDRFSFGGKIVAAYMPTWRGARRSADIEGQKLQIVSILKTLDDRLSDDVLLFVNLHFLVTGGLDFSKFKHIAPFPTDLETYEFLSACDTLITDYSSVMFDFAATGRKIILYPYDKQEYLATKGTYLPYDELPFDVVMSAEELSERIVERSYVPYPAFQEQFCRYASGHAATDVLDTVIRGAGSALESEAMPPAVPKNVLYLCGSKRPAVNDIILADLASRPLSERRNVLFVCSGKTDEESVRLLLSASRLVPCIATVTDKAISPYERILLYVASRISSVRIAASGLLRTMANREIGRILPGVSVESFTDLNAGASYLMKLFSFTGAPLFAIVRDGSIAGVKRAAQTSRFLGKFQCCESNVHADRKSVSEANRVDYYSGGLDATLLTRSYLNAQSSYKVSGLMRVHTARGIDVDELPIELEPCEPVGRARRVIGTLWRYEISIDKSILPTLQINSFLRLTYSDSEGFSGSVRIAFWPRERHCKNRFGRRFISPELGTTSYFRQGARGKLCFTTRNTTGIDARGEQPKIWFAWALSRLVPAYRDSIVLFEKESSRYEESASVVYERLLNEGNTNAYFILNAKSLDFEKVPRKFRRNVVPKYSLKHYLLFFSASTFVGTEMLGHAIDLRPANKHVIRRLGDKNINYVFLQHGVMYMLSLDSSSRAFFKPKALNGLYRVVISGEPELRHFVERGGYDPSMLYMTGLPKYDRNLMDSDADLIAIMPTWRPWEYNLSRIDFSQTGYYRLVRAMFECVPRSLRDKVIILPHPLFKEAAEGQDFECKSYFEDGTKSYNAILRKTKLLITDYSSIAYDAFYRGANVLFCWQDMEHCLEEYGEGSEIMLSRNTAFGKVCDHLEDMGVREFIEYYKSEQSAVYRERYRRIVKFHDGHNTDRLLELMRRDGLVS